MCPNIFLIYFAIGFALWALFSRKLEMLFLLILSWPLILIVTVATFFERRL